MATATAIPPEYALQNLPKTDVIELCQVAALELDESKKAEALPIVAEGLIDLAVGSGTGFADSQIDDGQGVAVTAATAMIGGTIAWLAADQAPGLAKAGRAVASSALSAGAHQLARQAGLKEAAKGAAERARKRDIGEPKKKPNEPNA